MNVNELIEKLKKFDKNLEILIVGIDEYGCEIENLKLKSIEKSDCSNSLYINITQ